MIDTKILGQRGEEVVAQWLISYGFKILARNFTTKDGEVDIIAQYNEIVAFVEVKARLVEYFSPTQAVTYKKQCCIIKAAKKFIMQHQLFDNVLRFDVATVIFHSVANNKHDINYIKNAFTSRF